VGRVRSRSLNKGRDNLAPIRLRNVLATVSTLAFIAAGAGLPATGTASAAPTEVKSPTTANVASYALTTGDEFSWILPLRTEVATEPWDWEVEEGSWMPLYYAGVGPKTGINYGVSIGKPPVYSNGDTTVTITLNTDFTWSDGQKVTSTDVKFFFELQTAGKRTLGDFRPGAMPQDITSITYPGPYTVVLHLDHAYNPTWFTGNQLTWIYPLPAQSWDKTCADCPVDGAATTPAGAKRVVTFLFSQSKVLRTYATNPLWKTVDGPWVISSYDAATYATSFTANPHYTGPDMPKLAGYKIYSFTTGTAELDALRSGSLTFGYIPLSDISTVSYFEHHGFTIKTWKLLYDENMEFGYTSKTWGSLVKQLYIRQALQHLVTEHLYITKTLHGYGITDYGLVADISGSPYVSPTLKKDPYPYSLSAAKLLLTEHGWKVETNGTDVCERPGTGSGDCGAGIAKGRNLSFPFVYSTGTTAFAAQVSAFATAARKVGIAITLKGETTNTMYSTAGVCPATPPCKYGLAGYAGYMWDYGQDDTVPTGEFQFGQGNFWGGGYYTTKAQQLIDAAVDSPGAELRSIYAAENYLSKDVAGLWWPLEDSVVAVKKNLKGWSLSPYGTVVPQTWSFSG
jgi:peptide/nickel transport system substrate-binding protein